jgi:hypothetical protein
MNLGNHDPESGERGGVGMREIKIVVIAGNRRQFDEWIRSNVIFADEPQKLYGIDLKNSHLVKVGTFYENKNSEEIEIEYFQRSNR